MSPSMHDLVNAAGKRIEAIGAAATRHETRFGEDQKMVWHVWGDESPEKPTLVLFHGGFGSWRHWAENVEALATSFRVIAADTPGLGESDRPTDDATPESLGEIVASGLQQIVGDESIHIAAFSFGGVVTGGLLNKIGDQIKSITMCGTSGMGLRRELQELVRRTPEMTEQQRMDAQFENLKRLMLYQHDDIDPGAIYIHFKNDSMARLRSRRMSLGDNLAVALRNARKLGIQLNGIWGEFDYTARPWIVDRAALIRDECPTSQFAVIADAGHWVAFEKADVFNATLLRFLHLDTPTRK